MLGFEAAQLRDQAVEQAAAARALRRELATLEALLDPPAERLTPEVWQGAAAEEAHAGLQDAKSKLAAALDALDRHIWELDRHAEQLGDSAAQLLQQATVLAQQSR